MANTRFFQLTDRSGMCTLAQICAFLGGLLFSALLLLIQQKSAYEIPFLGIPMITELQVIVIPLIFSIILFIFSAFFVGVTCSVKDDTAYNKMANETLNPIILGFISFFFSLFIVLLLADVIAGVIGIVLAIYLTYWWFNIDKSPGTAPKQSK